MSIKDQFSQDFIQKMYGKTSGEAAPVTDKPDAVESNDWQDIEQELLQQAEREQEGDASTSQDAMFLDMLSGPLFEDGNNKLVEVEYMGKVGFIDIKLETLDMSEEEYHEVIHWVDQFAFGEDPGAVRQAINKLASMGDSGAEVIMQQVRKFDLTNPQKKNETIQLFSRLTIRSLKGRRLIKGVLQRSRIEHQIRLAILTAGVNQDREVASDLLVHAASPEYFADALEALLQIRVKESFKPMLGILLNLDPSMKTVVDRAHDLAKRFYLFGPETVKDVYEAFDANEKHQLRPVLSVALRSYREESIPFLLQVLETEEAEFKVTRICRTLGSLRNAFATKALREAFDRHPLKQAAILDGLSHTSDPSQLPFILNIFETTENLKLKQSCIHAIAGIGGEEQIKVLRPLTANRKDRLYIHALFGLVKLGDQTAVKSYLELMRDSNSDELYFIERNMNRLPFRILSDIAHSVRTLPDDKALLMITALQRVNVPPKDVGQVLRDRLRTAGNVLKTEIYRLIGQHVNTKREILPQSVLYDALHKEDNVRVKRDLQDIISRMPKDDGFVTIRNGGGSNRP